MAPQLLAGGGSLESVALTVGQCVESGKRYKAVFNTRGVAALDKMSVGGRKSALDEEARAWIVEAVRGSPRCHGFDIDRWSNPALQALIKRQFGQRFSTVYVRQLMINLGVHYRMRTFKAPMRRAPVILDDEALSWIAAALRHSPRLHDFDSDRWTNERLATIIGWKFGVRYSRNHVWRTATDLGLSQLLSKAHK
jgi:transposase